MNPTQAALYLLQQLNNQHPSVAELEIKVTLPNKKWMRFRINPEIAALGEKGMYALLQTAQEMMDGR
jgi:hypothetical protein